MKSNEINFNDDTILSDFEWMLYYYIGSQIIENLDDANDIIYSNNKNMDRNNIFKLFLGWWILHCYIY